jgi:hypothetical protein
MPVSATNTYTGSAIAEDFENTIRMISPEDTPLYTMANKTSATNTYHQWTVHPLAAANTNRQLEGDDSTFATLSAPTVLGNYCQISSKTVQVSSTYDAVKKYGRKSEIAYQLARKGVELRRDMEYALVRNQASDNGSVGTVRSSAGMESWINGNNIKSNNAQTTPGFAAGIVAAPTDGTATTFLEADLKSALAAAWTDGGDPTTIMMSTKNKALFNSFAGVAQKYNDVGMKNSSIIGSVDIYVSDFGNHRAVLNRYMRDNAVLCIDPDHVGVATLRPIQKVQLAKTGDSEKWLLNAEYCLTVTPDAHAKVSGVGV